MATIPRDFVSDLTARTNIIDIISPYVQLKKAGKEYKACCPFHHEKTPSFTISPEKNFYHCFGCEKNGDPLQFLMDYHKFSYVEAVEELAKQHGLTVPTIDDGKPRENTQPLYELNALAASFFQEQLHRHPAAVGAQKYCRQRGLNKSAIEQFAIGFAPPGWDNFLKHATGHQFSVAQCVKAGLIIQKSEDKVYDRFRHRLMFPIRDQRGRVIAFGGRAIQADDDPKYLNSPETPLFHKGHQLYGLWEASNQQALKGLILVEGYMDVVALSQYGIPGAVATLGTATTASHLEKCFRYKPQLFFCFDGDSAGKKAAWRALETALPCLKEGNSIRFLFLPQDEDPDTFVRKFGTDAFIQRLEHGTPLTDFFFSHLMQDLDITQLDQKAQLANRASPLIRQVPDAILRELMFNTLSQHVQLPLSVLKDVSEQAVVNAAHVAPATTSPAQRPRWRQSSTHKLTSPMRMAIALLLQHPELGKDSITMDDLQPERVPGTPLLLALINAVRKQKFTSTEAILQQWPDDITRQHLEKCASIEHCIPADGVLDEYLGALQRIREQHERSKVDDLMAKARTQGLSDAEKHELHRLLGCLNNQNSTNSGV